VDIPVTKTISGTSIKGAKMIGALIVKKMASRGFDRLNKRDLESFMSGFADDAVFVYPETVSAGGTFKGKKAIREWTERCLKQFPELTFVVKKKFVENLFAPGSTNTVSVQWDFRCKNRDGIETTNQGVTIIHIKGGKAVLVEDYIQNGKTHKITWGEK
jgi:ketosteroid isomerase-like protein